MSKEEKWDKKKIRVGTSVVVKVGDIDEKIRKEKNRMMRKELVGWTQFIMLLLCLKTEVCINSFSNSLKLHFYAAVILSCCNQSLLQIVLGALFLLECKKHQSRLYPEARCKRINGYGGGPL